MSTVILLIGAFDVKGEEYGFVKRQIENQDCSVLTMNIGVLVTRIYLQPTFPMRWLPRPAERKLQNFRKTKIGVKPWKPWPKEPPH